MLQIHQLGAIIELAMATKKDQPLDFEKSLNDLVDTFRNVIASMTWLKASAKDAQEFYKNYLYITQLASSIASQDIKIDKSILALIEKEGLGGPTPLFTQTLTNFYRVFTVAAKDILWEDAEFQRFLRRPELVFLRHLRNASAHDNKFFWGNGRQRTTTIQKLPVSWRGKVIEEKVEGITLYIDFMKPGDIFLLLSDISSLV